MVKMVGIDKKIAKRVSCRECGAILEYMPNEVKTYRTSCMGETGTAWYVDCPNFKDGEEPHFAVIRSD
jgi:hypothetical protein